METPLWLNHIGRDENLKADFNKWADDAFQVYAFRALTAAKSMDELLGLRFAAGEIMALKGILNYEDEELEREINGMA